MRRALRVSGILLALAGSLLLVWALVVWRWQDPFTLYFNKRDQARLSKAYEVRVQRVRAERPVTSRGKAEAAASYRRRTRVGDPIGRLIIPRLGLRVMVVLGTDSESLESGPGLHQSTGFPGQGRLTYVAGHRTTYGAPFAAIDRLRPGDRVTFEVPYGTYRYAVTGHRIVDDQALEALRSRGREELALQACWPRFFASQRYIAYARLTSVQR